MEPIGIKGKYYTGISEIMASQPYPLRRKEFNVEEED